MSKHLLCMIREKEGRGACKWSRVALTGRFRCCSCHFVCKKRPLPENSGRGLYFGAERMASLERIYGALSEEQKFLAARRSDAGDILRSAYKGPRRRGKTAPRQEEEGVFQSCS